MTCVCGGSLYVATADTSGPRLYRTNNVTSDKTEWLECSLPNSVIAVFSLVSNGSALGLLALAGGRRSSTHSTAEGKSTMSEQKKVQVVLFTSRRTPVISVSDLTTSDNEARPEILCPDKVDLSWTQQTTLPWLGYDCIMGWRDDIIVVCGGWCNGESLGHVAAYDVQQQRWCASSLPAKSFDTKVSEAFSVHVPCVPV